MSHESAQRNFVIFPNPDTRRDFPLRKYYGSPKMLDIENHFISCFSILEKKLIGKAFVVKNSLGVVMGLLIFALFDGLLSLRILRFFIFIKKVLVSSYIWRLSTEKSDCIVAELVQESIHHNILLTETILIEFIFASLYTR